MTEPFPSGDEPGFVKICGITSEEDALLAIAMGADALGFVFAPSKRQIAVGRVSDIVKRLPNDVLTFGVFRDDLPERVVEQVQRAGLRGAQLHGHERPDQVSWVRERVEVTIKEFAAGTNDAANAKNFHADAYLIEGGAPGSGEVFDWSLVEGFAPGRRWLLAGGLSHRNVAEAIAQVRPWGVDVSSGVESSPGRKDALKLKAFIANARMGFEQMALEALASDGDLSLPREAPYDWKEE